MKEINQKHQSIKFEFKFSKKKCRFSKQTGIYWHQQQTPDQPLQKKQMTIKNICMLNWQTDSHVKGKYYIQSEAVNETYISNICRIQKTFPIK